MIARLEQFDVDTGRAGRQLELARRVVASAFYPLEGEPAEPAPPVRAWQAWLFAAWVVIVTGVYFATMLGLI